MTTSVQELQKFLEPYTKEELAQLVITRAQNNSVFSTTFLKIVKADKKWCKLFVHGLSYSTTNETLHEFYSKFGNVVEAVVLMDKKGQSKGYGFVTFSDAEEALNAVKIERKKIDGRTTHCNLAFKGNPKKWQNGNNGNAFNPNNLPGTRVTDSSRDERRLFVHSLAWKTDDETLAQSFRSYGELEEAVVIRDKKTTKSKGYGFVTFKFAESARAALVHPEKIIDGRQTKCNLACERANTISGLAAAAAAAYSGYSFQPSQQQQPIMNGLQRSHSDPLSMVDTSSSNVTSISLSGYEKMMPAMHKSQSLPSNGAMSIAHTNDMFLHQPHHLFVTQPVTNIPVIPYNSNLSNLSTAFIPHIAPSVSSGSAPLSPPPPLYPLNPIYRPPSANSQYGISAQGVFVANSSIPPYNTVLTQLPVSAENFAPNTFAPNTFAPNTFIPKINNQHKGFPGTTTIIAAANLPQRQLLTEAGLNYATGRSSPLTQRSHSPIPGSPKSQPDENTDRVQGNNVKKNGIL